MTTMTTTRPFRHDEPHAAYQHWVGVTGLDTGTPQWQSVWQALHARALVGEGGLRMREQDLADPELVQGTSVNSRIVQMALIGAARYVQELVHQPPAAGGEAPRWPAEQVTGADPMDPVLGVEIALALIFEFLPPQLLDQPVEHAVGELVTEMIRRVVGVFANPRAALTALIEQCRHDQDRPVQETATRPQPWPALVETILAQSVEDEVFAEHIFVTAKNTGAAQLSFTILPRGHWLIVRTGALPEPTRQEP